MKKLVVVISVLFCFFLAFASTTYEVVQAAPIGSINDDIQPDAVNLNAVGITNTETSTQTNTQTTVQGEHIQTLTTQIKVEKDGTIQVNENIIYDFGNLSKHGIYRTIPTVKTNQDGKKYRLNLKVISVKDENNGSYKYSIVDSDEQVEIKIGDADRTITGVHTYNILYIISGAITYFSEHDELYWNATGNSWTVPIVKAIAQVEFPSVIKEENITTTCYTGSTGSNTTSCKATKKANSAYFVSSEILYANQGMTIVAGFPKGVVAVVEPQKVVPFSETLLGKLFFLLLTLLMTFWYVIYPFMIIYQWWKYGRDPKATVGTTTAWFDPPKSPKNNRFLTPGEVGTLGDETVDMKDISSTIVDLARRGYIKIEERKKGDYYFTKTKEFNSGLLSFESKLLTGMFNSKKEIRLKDQKLYETVTDVTKNLYDDVVSEGLFPKNPSSIRTYYSVIAVFALFTGNFFLAIVAFLFGRNMPRKTLDGVNAFNIAKSLKNFLTSQERQLEFQAKNQMMFEKLLPYAIAFGVEKIWAKRFATINMQQPDWYQGYNTNQFNSVVFANSLNSSLSSFKSSASPPTSTRSTSGFSSGFSGGFSGGGGGGGGGGSW